MYVGGMVIDPFVDMAMSMWLRLRMLMLMWVLMRVGWLLALGTLLGQMAWGRALAAGGCWLGQIS